jgi:hypothetical protein
MFQDINWEKILNGYKYGKTTYLLPQNNYSSSINNLVIKEFTINLSSETLPTDIIGDITVINIDNMTSNLNINNWISSLINVEKIGCRVVIRKIDDSNNIITYNDSIIDYKFINKKGEYIVLYWDGLKFVI